MNAQMIDPAARQIPASPVASMGASLQVRSPYDGRLAREIPTQSASAGNVMLKRAKAFRSELSRFERSTILATCARYLADQKDVAANLITTESGLCLQDSKYEVGRVCDVLNLGASACLQDLGETFACDLTHHGKQRRSITQREPLLGVIAAITPFNHPMNQVAHKVVPSIATNNRIVVKPSEKTPLSALFLRDLLYAAGLPEDMFQVLVGSPEELGPLLIRHADVDLVTFTGGTRIGKFIAESAGYRRIVLELGGNDPLIVLRDADIDKAAELAVAGSFKNSGQRCTAIKRILVDQLIAARFTEAVVARTRTWTYGDPWDDQVRMGTVISESAAIVIQNRVNDAVAQGARLLLGDQRRGALYSPTILDRVTPKMRLVAEETFGPVAPIMTFQSLDETIAISNGTSYGLSCGVCTDDYPQFQRLCAELHVGTVNLWEVPGYRTELSPFGGIKDSGLGYKEGVYEAMKAFTNVKSVNTPWQ